MNAIETLKAQIAASERDLAYCYGEIENLKANAIEYPINAGYSAKEIVKTKNIIKSHESRIAKAKAAIAAIEEEEAKKETKEDFKGKKFIKCRRCSGTGSTGFTHVDNGRCFACNGSGQKKSKAYLVYLGEWYEDKFDPRWVF